MVQHAGDLAKHSPDPLGALGNIDVEQLFDGEREALLIGHHADVVEAVEVGQGLQVRLVLDELLGAAVQQPHVRIRPDDLLAVELQDQPQHPVRRRVLRPEVDRVVPQLALLGALPCVRLHIHVLRVARVDRVRERVVRLDQPRRVLVDLGLAGERRGEGLGGGDGGLEGRGSEA